jgi:hypothetical protein
MLHNNLNRVAVPIVSLFFLEDETTFGNLGNLKKVPQTGPKMGGNGFFYFTFRKRADAFLRKNGARIFRRRAGVAPHAKTVVGGRD